MERTVAALGELEHDVVVVGGGTFGIFVAWDAALRGLSVAIVDRGDFAGATSANSFRMIHGGIRYLQHGDVSRLRESSRERSVLLRIAPHLTRPLPIVVPTYGRGLRGRGALRVACGIYDVLTLDRNAGIADPARRIPPCRFISRDACLAMFPGLDREGLTGASVFCDGQMVHPPRLALACLGSAVEAGAVAANYVEATGFLRVGDRVAGVAGIDRMTGERVEVRGRLVVNAAGPWAERLLREHLGIVLHPRPAFSRDVCLVVARPLVGDHGLAVLGRTRDPDAVLSRGRRHLFIVPWQECTLIGVWHAVHMGDPDGLTVTDAEIDTFLGEINEAYPGLGLRREDVSACHTGLVLFGRNREGAVDLSYGKRSIVVDHARTHRLPGLVTVIGVRWTTCRRVAETVVDLVFERLGRTPPPCRTETIPVRGGRIDDFESLVARAVADRPRGVDPEAIRSLVHSHGTEYRRILEYATADPGLLQPLGQARVLRAEVVHAARHEMALTLADIALRRTHLATRGDPGRAALGECAALAANELGWDDTRRARELNELGAALSGRLAAAGSGARE